MLSRQYGRAVFSVPLHCAVSNVNILIWTIDYPSWWLVINVTFHLHWFLNSFKIIKHLLWLPGLEPDSVLWQSGKWLSQHTQCFHSGAGSLLCSPCTSVATSPQTISLAWGLGNFAGTNVLATAWMFRFCVQASAFVCKLLLELMKLRKAFTRFPFVCE